MTVFHPSCTKHQNVRSKPKKSLLYKVHLFGLFLCAIFLVAYITLSTQVVAKRYEVSVHKQQLAQLHANAAADNGPALGNEMQSLVSFAQRTHMVENKDTEVMFEEGNVAFNTGFVHQ